MKTTSIGIENLCVPCHASCRYCLLCSCRKATGVSYRRGRDFARRVYEELGAKRPDLHLFYYIGYCMDTPDLTDYIRFSREIGSPAGRFLQFNGLAFRSGEETEKLIRLVKAEGVESIDLTFYGTREYHDRFAGRAGDFAFLLDILVAANRGGLRADVSLPLTRESLGQTDKLLNVLDGYEVGRKFIFLPHSKGRGRVLDGQRLTREEFDGLSRRVKDCFSKAAYLSEREWLERAEWEQPEGRSLTLCLTPDNIEKLETMPVEELVAYLEGLDDQYYAQVPAIAELAARYGDKHGRQMFRIRDLHLKWQQMYLADHPGLYDMNDETHHFSVRI